MFRQIKQESTREKVHAVIKEAIISGDLKTGERITETNLAENLNVSRQIVREALQQLAYEGLVEQNSYKGTRVVHLSLDQVNEILTLRLLLETEAVRLAKENMTNFEKSNLRSMAKNLEASQKDARDYVEQDLALHEKIWQLSGNQTLCRMLINLTGPLFAMGTIIRNAKIDAPKTSSQPEKEQTKYQSADHITLIDAICDGTTEDAEQAMREHISRNSKYTRENFERFYAMQHSKGDAAKTNF